MIMAALGPKARALVQEGRNALRPAAGDRERIEAALRVHLGPGALPPPSSVAPPPPVGAAAGWQALAAKVLVGAGIAGGALYLAFSDRTPAPPANVSAPPAVPTVAAAASNERVSEVPAPTESHETAEPIAAHPATASSEAAPRARDRLAEEVALLSRATTALRAGRAAEALKTLDEHQSRFPRGALSEERRAAKAQALCSLGRMSEGRAELVRLAPQSPAAARAKQVCDSSSNK